MRRLGLKPVLTLNHFTLPSWLHDPLATRRLRRPRADDPLPELSGGWLDPTTVREFGERAMGSSPLRQARGHLGHRQRADGRGQSGYANVLGAFAA